MSSDSQSLENLIHASSRALVIGVGGGGDVVGALATARFLEFCGLEFVLGGLSWERSVYDPVPGPRLLSEVENVRVLHPRVWMANPKSQTKTGVFFAESKMAAVHGKEILLVDINGGVNGVVEGLEVAIKEFKTDLLVGLTHWRKATSQDCAALWQIPSCSPHTRSWKDAGTALSGLSSAMGAMAN